MNTYLKLLLGLSLTLISFRWWPEIPSVISVLSLLLIAMICRKFLSSFIFGCLIGVLLASFFVTWYKYSSSVAQSMTANTTIAGQVHSLLSENQNSQQKIFVIDQIESKPLGYFERFRLRLYVPDKYQFRDGERWAIKARIREPYGRANEAGFDAEIYYLSHQIHGKGTLLSATRLDNEVSFRQAWFDRLTPTFEHLDMRRYLIALGFGERSELNNQDWQWLKETGLAHLMAISGLHIGLVYFWGFLLFRGIRLFIPMGRLGLFFPYAGGFLLAFLYAALSGFALPTLRALLVLFICNLIRVSGGHFSPAALFLTVLTCVLISNPFVVFSMSFWLSFGAVACICVMAYYHFNFQAHGVTQKIQKFTLQFLWLQLALTIGMLPVMNQSFGGLSVTSMFSNFIAIPIVAWITVPSILLAIICFPLGLAPFFWMVADVSIHGLFTLVNLIQPLWISTHMLSVAALMMVVGIALHLCVFECRKSRMLFCVAVLSLLTFRPLSESKDPQAWQMDVLDVGHGLATLIEKNGEAVLYDTGASWGNVSIASMVIHPILEKRNIRLVGVMVSHSDSDHAGGLSWLKKAYPEAWVRASDQNPEHDPCLNGTSWVWKDLNFSAISPEVSKQRPKNPDSCVIQVSDGVNQVLLTGDLPRQQEKYLIQKQIPLKADVLLVPHHGSLSSSSLAFLNAVNPQAAIVSNGRYTPWNLPAPNVVSRYQDLGIDWYQTSRDGQVSIHFDQSGWRISRFRQDVSPYWFRE